MIVGLPGSGKTTLAAHLVRQAIKKKIRVFSNVYIKGALEFNWSTNFGYTDMSNSLILLDESGLELDCRNWEKNFKKEQVSMLKLIRHYRSKLVVFSQTWNDTDIKIRQMVGKLYILKQSLIPFCSVCIPIWRKIDVDEDDHDFKELYYKDGFFFRIFSCKRIFRPKYYKMFDSFDAPKLKDFDYKIYS